MSLLLLSEDELRQVVTISDAIEVIKSALITSAQGRIDTPGEFTLNLLDVNGEVDVKGSYIQDAPYYVVKVDSYFQNNPAINLPGNSGLVTVFDAATGFPAAIMADNGYLANIRAGVSGALSAQHLANQQLNQVAVIGTDGQAYIQLKALMVVKEIPLVKVWGPSPLDADTYARRMVEDHDVNIEIASTAEEAVGQADLIITTIAHPNALLDANWIKPGVHITAVGSHRPSLPKLHPNILRQADLLVVDNLEKCSRFGEVQHGLAANTITMDDIHGDLGNLVYGTVNGRMDINQITLADLIGLDIIDTVVATLALEKALFFGLGQRVGIGLGQEQLGQRIQTLS